MNILNAIRKYILAARPAYKDFLGRETKCITIGSLTVNEDSADDNVFFASLSEPSFTGFKAGEIYTVSIDGVESERKGLDLGNIVIIGSGNSIAEIQDDDYGWFAGVYDGHIALQPMNLDAFVEQYLNKEFIITQTTMEEKWYIKKLPEECVPDSITKTVKRNKQKIATLEGNVNDVGIHADLAYSTANSAKTAAATAQNTANAAKTAAATAQNTANAAKTAAATAQSTADTAKTNASKAQSTADTAKTTAEAAATKNDPVFSGSFSQNRKAGTPVGKHSHAEGHDTIASNDYSHAEGGYTIANGMHSHAEGTGTTASGQHSHAEGMGTVAQGDSQHVQGLYNIPSGSSYSYDPDKDYIHIVGNGNGFNECSNAHTLTYGGVPWYQGRPQFGGNAMDDGAQTVMANGDEEITMKSQNKKFKITVDDTGAMSVTNVDDTSESKTFQRVGENIILNSSTSGSTKKFKITVDDTGAISATEVAS